MYVVVKVSKVKKGFEEVIKEKFSKQSAVQQSPGFIKSELLIDKKAKDYDLVRQQIYFEDRKAYYVWQGSPAHVEAHKYQRENNIPKPEYIIEGSKEEYDLVANKVSLL